MLREMDLAWDAATALGAIQRYLFGTVRQMVALMRMVTAK